MDKKKLALENPPQQPTVVSLATTSDAEGILNVVYQTWLATYPNEEAGITKEDIEDQFAKPRSDEGLQKRREEIENQPTNERWFVARKGEKIVGVCRVRRTETKNELLVLYVLPEYQRTNVGNALWSEARKFLDVTKDTIVKTTEYSVGAINFYKKLGFQDTGERFQHEGSRMKSGAMFPEMTLVLKATQSGE